MSNEVYNFALKSTLQEIQNACPDMTSSFIFKDRELIAKDNITKEETAKQTIVAFNKAAENAAAIGGLKSLTVQSIKGKAKIIAMKDFHLTTVSSKKADEKYINTLTRVLIPIVIKLVEEIQSNSAETATIKSDDDVIALNEPEPDENEVEEEAIDETNPAEVENTAPAEINEESTMQESTGEEKPVDEVDDEPLLPEPPVMQLMVENLRGFRVPSDTVRVDDELILQWDELYSDKKITEVEIEALNGKKTICKFKKIKKSKDAGKGIVKMPEKIQLALEVVAGELVTVKPYVE
jgi:hypothetical protein